MKLIAKWSVDEPSPGPKIKWFCGAKWKWHLWWRWLGYQYGSSELQGRFVETFEEHIVRVLADQIAQEADAQILAEFERVP